MSSSFDQIVEVKGIATLKNQNKFKIKLCYFETVLRIHSSNTLIYTHLSDKIVIIQF